MSEQLDKFAPVPTGVRLCFREDGPIDGPAILLIAGLGEDLTSWSDAFISALVGRGYRVLRHDNRDSGRSSTIDRRPPNPIRQLFGRPRADAYRLSDMAADSVGLLDHLGIERVHLVGRSMGGMIAQSIAARWPARAASLTSIYSTTGALDVGQPTLLTRLLLVASPPPKNREAAAEGHVKMLHYLGGAGYPIDEVTEHANGLTAWDRAGSAGPAGVARQIQAIQATGSRTSELAQVVIPTVVINGDRDLIVDPSGGRATAHALRGSRHLVVPGMGHHLHDDLIEIVVTEIEAMIATADLTAEHSRPV